MITVINKSVFLNLHFRCSRFNNHGFPDNTFVIYIRNRSDDSMFSDFYRTFLTSVISNSRFKVCRYSLHLSNIFRSTVKDVFPFQYNAYSSVYFPDSEFGFQRFCHIIIGFQLGNQHIITAILRLSHLYTVLHIFHRYHIFISGRNSSNLCLQCLTGIILT